MARDDVVPWSMARTYLFLDMIAQAFGMQPSGLKMRLVLAGYFASIAAGRIGRGTRLPPQFGQVPLRGPSAQLRQKVHSKLQIMASRESGGRSRSQHSQLGRSSSMLRSS